MAAAIGGGGCFIALDGGRFGLPGCSLLLRLHRRARVLRGSGYGGGGARSLRPCCLTAGRFAIADTCSYRLPDGSAPLLPVLAVGRSRPLRSRAPRPVTSPSAVGRPDAPPSRGEPGTPRSARPASAVCLASRPAARFRRSPGGSPPPPPAAPASAAPPGGLAGGALRGGACSKAAAAVSGHFPYGLRKRESRLAPNAKTFSAFSQVSGIGPLPRGRSAA